MVTNAVLQQGLLQGFGKHWIGLCLLFSAGTFLYVATVHVLPEVSSAGRLSWTDVSLLSLGILLPLAFSVEHEH